MKTQRTKLVARIAVALLAGMMVLALAGCGSKNPLKGHTYANDTNKVTFTDKELSIDNDTFSYTLDSESLTGTAYYSGSEAFKFSYRADGSSIEESGIILERVK